ncbi:glycosyltransferase family 4 protein [Flavobacterium chungbukense]|uniref:Glycosyl transferase family 1 domain-containing protein n=1 Tax=Flavobacterium chungbukense TaxID=877464 RepID=A0ABP7Y6S2_9FLAO|nr:glycosyltransferase family 4 protein [Flavobacterium chungbukense]MCC4923785.1 glycosyltransferase family 4 protein [Flavobacterium chungbukense]
MKILIIGPFPKPINGCSLANEVLLKQLKFEGGISVDIINTNAKNISSDNVGHFSFAKVFSFLKVYRKIFSISNSDVVYTTPGQTFYGIVKYMPFYFYCLLIDKPYIIHVHGNHLGNEYKSLKGFKKWFFSFFINRSSAGIVLSNSLKVNFDGLLIPRKVFVVENFAQDDLVQKAAISKPKDKLRLLYLSNLMEEKGIIDFLDSLILLKKKGTLFEADIAGIIEEESEAIIKNKFNELQGFINYHGVVSGKSKIDLLQKSNIFILPTYYRMEGQPISLIEAMAAGNIIVTTEFSGIPDIISTENGRFVSSKSPESIFRTLLEINEKLEECVDKYSRVNMKYVQSYFTEAQFANKVFKVIQHI